MLLAALCSYLWLLLSRYSTTAFRLVVLPQSRRSTKLRDIHVWRRDHAAREREICILAFPLGEALLQGETKQFRLHEKFVKVFDECMEDSGAANAGVVAMGLIAAPSNSNSAAGKNQKNGILTQLPLCEMEEYSQSIEASGLETVVTLRVVGRVELKKLTQETPYMKATCLEILDDTSALNLSEANVVASDIEHVVFQLGRLDYQLEMYAEGNEWILAEDQRLDLVRQTNDRMCSLLHPLTLFSHHQIGVRISLI
jgi:hypothetical protein